MPTGTLKRADSTESNLVDTTIRDLKSIYLESERKIHHLRKLRFMKSRVSAPRPYQNIVAGGVRSPLSYRLVQTIVGMICKDRPTYKRLAIDRDHRDSASRLQAAADPLMQDLERIARKPLYHHFVDAVVADGRGAMKLSRDAWTGFPLQIDGEQDKDYNKRVASFVMSGAQHPLRMRMVDALNFKVPLVDYDPPYVLETGKRPTLAVMNAYGLKFNTRGGFETMEGATNFHTLELPSGVSPTIDVEELWLKDEVFVRVGGPVGGGTVFKAPNDLGFIPYVWASGETSSHPDPSLNSLSVLYPYAGIEPWLNTMLTVLTSWGVIGGTPILYTSKKLPPNGQPVPDAAVNLSDIPLGKRIDLGYGGEIGFVTPPPVGREILEFIQFLVDYLDRAGLPSLAYGSIGTRTPGTAFQGALEQAIARVNPIVTSCENAFSEMVTMHWRMVEAMGVPIYVTGIGPAQGIMRRKALGRYKIDPRDIAGYYDLHAKIQVGNTQDAISRGMHAAFMRDKKLWSRDRAMDYSGVEDPFSEYSDIMRDTLEESPLVQELTLMNALGQDKELAARAYALQEQGVPVEQLLLGGMAGGVAGAPAGGSPAATPAGSAPAPRRGGKPKGSPKNPGGTRQNAQGSRGHG